jgi:hypothetical protein
MIGEIFNNEGIIRPLKAAYMSIKPAPSKVDYFGRMYTAELVRNAKSGKADFELFFELHRRAAARHLKHHTRYEWDDNIDGSCSADTNAVFLGNYDRKWGIFVRNGHTYVV